MIDNIALRVVLLSLVTTFIVLIPQPVLSQSKAFIVPPTNKRARYPKAKSKEKLTISGEVRIIPLRGATVVLVTPNLGQIIIAKLLSLPSDVIERLEALNASGYSVDATGYVVTLCTDREIKKSIAAGCRVFDESKPISIRQY